MRPAAFAIACFLGATVIPAAVAQPLPAIEAPVPAPNAPPYPNGGQEAHPPSPAAPAGAPERDVPADARAYAPAVAPSPAAAGAPKGRSEPAHHGRVCFGQAETRDKIAQRRLADPVRAMRAGRAEGEALRTRLCHWKGDDLVYEIYVLRRDGRVVRLYMNAQNGEAVSAADAVDRR